MKNYYYENQFVAMMWKSVQVSYDDYVMQRYSRVFQDSDTVKDLVSWAKTIDPKASITDIIFSNLYKGD